MKNYRGHRWFQQIRSVIIGCIDFFYPPFRKWMPIQTFRYLACGGTVTLWGLLVYFLSYNFIFKGALWSVGFVVVSPYIAAYIVSFFAGFPVGFFLSKFVVFQESSLKGRIQLLRYAILQGLNILLNYALLHFFAGYLGFWATPSQAVTTALIAVFSYFFQRHVSFRTVLPAEEPAPVYVEEKEEPAI